MNIIDTTVARHYRWGAASEGWHLLQHPDLSVIEERIPAGDQEQRHYHGRARQFFYVLEGTALIELDGTEHRLQAHQGLEIPPSVPHQFRNISDGEVRVLVISAPPSHGDRVNLPSEAPPDAP